MVDADLLASIESMALYGDTTRIDTREQFRHGDPERGVETHWLTLSVYRPEELAEGTTCLVRTLKKSRRGAWLYKIVIAPNAHRLADEAFEEVAPDDFWQEAYWQYVGDAQTVDA